MKNLRQHFVAIKTQSRNRRDGGSNYTIEVYEVKKKGEFNRILTTTGCTASHKGESSEVFSDLIKNKSIRPVILKEIKANQNSLSYYTWSYIEKYGLKIQMINE